MVRVGDALRPRLFSRPRIGGLRASRTGFGGLLWQSEIDSDGSGVKKVWDADRNVSDRNPA